MEGGAWVQKYFGRKFTGLVPKGLWYHAEPSPSADASDDFLDYMPWAYNTTPEIHKAVLDGMKALTDAEDVAAGKKISKAIRDSRNRVLLWANHIPFALGPRIEYWEPEKGSIPPVPLN